MRFIYLIRMWGLMPSLRNTAEVLGYAEPGLLRSLQRVGAGHAVAQNHRESASRQPRFVLARRAPSVVPARAGIPSMRSGPITPTGTGPFIWEEVQVERHQHSHPRASQTHANGLSTAVMAGCQPSMAPPQAPT